MQQLSWTRLSSRKAVRDLLVQYLGSVQAVPVRSGFAPHATPDLALGDSDEEPSNVFLIVEVQRSLGVLKDSRYRGANCHMYFWLLRDDSHTFLNTCCPAFLLEVVGQQVQLWAVAWLDRARLFPLTPLLNLLPDHGVVLVARLLAAMRMGVQDLVNDQAAARAAGAQAAAAAAALRQPAEAFKQLPWPIRRDPRYNAAGALQLAMYNPIYYVPLASGDHVVVRLYREYGLAAHQAWAELDLAPKVLRV